jgi:hypothetical protein
MLLHWREKSERNSDSRVLSFSIKLSPAHIIEPENFGLEIRETVPICLWIENQEKAMTEENRPQPDQSEPTVTSGSGVQETGENKAKTPEQEGETMPSLEQLLKKAELDAAEHYDAWLRAKAEGENIRKRAQIDVTNAHK